MCHRKIAAFVLSLAFAFGITITSLPAHAAVPGTLNYLGQLATTAGAPVTGTVSITFKLYDAASGNLLWTETQSVTVSNGLYSVILGQINPLDASLFTANRNLGITVGTDSEMTPRITITSSATALRAALADAAVTAQGITCTGCVKATNIDLTSLVTAIPAGSITAGQLAAGVTVSGPPGPQGPAGLTGATGSAGTSAWVDGTGKVTTAVNVGVGTTTPTATLHVVGSMNIPGNNLQTAADTSNTLLGVSAGNATMTGAFNVANGNYALSSNTTGNFNLASGAGALNSNTTGNLNVASGYQALQGNTTGYQNTATGYSALSSNTTGFNNVADGSNSLQNNTTGYQNTAIGLSALRTNTTGTYNTAIGFNALFANSAGDNNIGIGALSGYNVTTGSYNIHIGNLGVAGDTKTIRIGDTSQNKTFISGIRATTTGVSNGIPVMVDGMGQLGTVNSSRRFKDDIADMRDASNLLIKLRPVTFTYKADKGAVRALQYGLIAEEVADIAPGLVAYSADGQIETVYYQFLAPMLLNEYQKQQRRIESQTAALTRQTARIADMETRLEQLESQLQLLLTQAQPAKQPVTH